MTIVDLRQDFFLLHRSVCKCTNGTDAQDVSIEGSLPGSNVKNLSPDERANTTAIYILQ
jgi:hypothetical protein